MKSPITISGGYATALSLNFKEKIQIVNLEGSQVVDAWAFCQSNFNEFLSTEHTRSCLEKLIPVHPAGEASFCP